MQYQKELFHVIDVIFKYDIIIEYICLIHISSIMKENSWEVFIVLAEHFLLFAQKVHLLCLEKNIQIENPLRHVKQFSENSTDKDFLTLWLHYLACNRIRY